MKGRIATLKDDQPSLPSATRFFGLSSWEWLGLLGLAGLTLFFLVTSWRKWPDPLIDFGRELYLPWRLDQGAVLYRDVDDIFGPLSQHFNAALFACFGPGLMVLVTANLAIFTAILTAIYALCRRAWGVSAALAAAAVFVVVFGFSQFVGCGNYNYATPYAHETTHGLLVCLLLAIVLSCWVEQATPRRSFVAGGLFGLTAVLKPEIMLAGGLITFAAAVIHWRQQERLRPRAIAAWAVGAVLPTLSFMVYFAAYMPWKQAVLAACQAWLSVTRTTQFTGDVIQSGFLGFDRPWEHFLEHAIATLFACLIIAVIGGVAWVAEHRLWGWARLLLSALLLAGLVWLGFFGIAWLEVGRCLLGLMLIYTFFSGVFLIRKPGPKGNRQARTTRLLLAVLAVALMARMALNGRIFHYGYYQAALAGLLVPAVLIGELPRWLGVVRWGRAIIVMSSLALLVPGVAILARKSQSVLRLKTHAVGEGVDRFYTFPPKIDPAGYLVRFISEALRKMPPGQTLLVLPDGVMINYLARRPNTLASVYFYSSATSDGREEQIVKELQQRPPDLVVIISRNLGEYGIRRYGEQPGRGQQLLQWVMENYESAVSVGGDPLDYKQKGAALLKRKAGR